MHADPLHLPGFGSNTFACYQTFDLISSRYEQLPSIVEFELDRLRILACSGNPFWMLRRGSIQQGEKKDEGLEGGGGVPASRRRGGQEEKREGIERGRKKGGPRVEGRRRGGAGWPAAAWGGTGGVLG